MMLGPYVLAIRSSLDSGESPRKIIAALQREHGAIFFFADGVYELQLADVKAISATGNNAGLLKIWMRAAERRVEQERAR